MALLNYIHDPRHRNVHDVARPVLEKINGGGLSFAALVQTHFTTVVDTKHISLKGQTMGLMFEMILLDGLIQHGVPVEMIAGQSKFAPVNAEMDIMIGHRTISSQMPPGCLPPSKKAVGLMVKTSVRERWKQADRDALIFTMIGGDEAICNVSAKNNMAIQRASDLSIFIVSVREHKDTKPAQAIRHMRGSAKKYRGIPDENVLSIFDEERMEGLLQTCLNL